MSALSVAEKPGNLSPALILLIIAYSVNKVIKFTSNESNYSCLHLQNVLS